MEKSLDIQRATMSPRSWAVGSFMISAQVPDPSGSPSHVPGNLRLLHDLRSQFELGLINPILMRRDLIYILHLDPSMNLAFDFQALLPVRTCLVGRRCSSSLSNDAGTRIRHRRRDSTSPPWCQRSFGFRKAVISNFSSMPCQLQLDGQFEERFSV